MQTRISGYVAKFFFEILPATVASAGLGYLVAEYGKPSAPTPPPPAAAATATAEVLKTVRDDHKAFVDYLKKATETRNEPGATAQPAEQRPKQEERNTTLASRQAKDAEARAQTEAKVQAEAKTAAARKAAAAKAATPPQVTAKAPTAPMQLAPPEAPLGQIVINRPSAVASAAAPPVPLAPPLPDTPVVAIAPVPQPATPPPAPAAETRGGPLHDAASSVSGWFNGGAPPRPPAALPQQNFSNNSGPGDNGG